MPEFFCFQYGTDLCRHSWTDDFGNCRISKLRAWGKAYAASHQIDLGSGRRSRLQFWRRMAETPSNLLHLSTVETKTIGFIEDGEPEVARLIDGDPETVAVFTSADGEPVDLLFAFNGGIVAPDSFAVTLSADADARPPARIDLLASTASPSSGFASLRTESIDPLKPNQQGRFAASAANWLLVRLFPAEGTDQVSLADISVGGKEGRPETTYAFGESRPKPLRSSAPWRASAPPT